MSTLLQLQLLLIHFASTVLSRKPNIILFVADDLGFGDLSTYGHVTQEAGSIDEMAKNGLKLTQLYTAGTFCTPSRAALLTGRQPFRTGMVGPLAAAIPPLQGGLHHDELTVAEALQQQGYSTSIVGKWHLGINNKTASDGVFLPHTHGFHYVGTILPFTLVTRCDTEKKYVRQPKRHSCFLYRNRTIVQQPINLKQLTNTLLTDAKTFLHENSDGPFFLYFSFPQVHTPMYNMQHFNGSSKRGAYGDSINEMSWAVGEVMDTVRHLGAENDTLTVFVSDHGPHLEMCDWGGDTGPFRGGKGSVREGGLRVPGIFHWPGKIRPNSLSDEVTSLMDIFPTLIHLAGGNPYHKNNPKIDGISLHNILINSRDEDTSIKPKSHHPRKALFIYDSVFDVLTAIRYKHFKIYYYSQPVPSPEDYRNQCDDGLPVQDYYFSLLSRPTRLKVPVMYDIVRDPAEMNPLNVQLHQQVLAEVEGLIEVEKETWSNRREKLLVERSISGSLAPCCNPPFCVCNFRRTLSSLGMCFKE